MDRCEILSTEATRETLASANRLEVEETTPLEPGDRETKCDARGSGLIENASLSLGEH